ncbi:peptidase inhibitor family I36 protein [Amycolatopsis sp. cmx-11-32]
MARAVSLIATVLLTAGIVTGTAVGPAAAATPCPSGEVCMYEGYNFTGTMRYMWPVEPGDCAGLTFKVLSVHNRSFEFQRLWANGNCTASNVLVAPGGKIGRPNFVVRSIGGR